MNPVDLVGTVEDECGGCSGHLGAPPEGQCGSHRFSLLDAAARGIRVERENGSEPKLGQMTWRRPGWEIALSPIVCVRFRGSERSRPRLRSFWSVGSIWENRAKISIEETGVASCRQVRDNGMASVSQLNPYQCDQCGTTNIVAAPVLYQQGTRAYSGTFNSGTSQSYSAQAAAPPRPRGYGRPFFFGDPLFFIFFCGPSSGFGSILEHPKTTRIRPDTVCRFLASWCGFSCRDGLQSSEDRPLQPRGLSSPPLELGAHLYLQALREASLDPFIVSAVRFTGLIGKRIDLGRSSAWDRFLCSTRYSGTILPQLAH